MYEADIFWYLDPPFFEKAARLYRHVFDMSGHLAFREALNELPGSFVLSYDCVTAAEAIYADDGRAMSVPLGRTSVSMTYAAAERDLRLAKELIVSDLLVDARTKIAVHNRVRAINMNKIRKRS
jgi:DNA adenine methylase